MNTHTRPQPTQKIATNHNETSLKVQLLLVGFALAGWGTETLGAPLVFIIGGTVTAGIALLALAHPAIRELD